MTGTLSRQFPSRRGTRSYLVAQPMAVLPRGRQDLSRAEVEMLEAQPYALTGRRVKGFAGDPQDDSVQAAIDKIAPVARALLQNDAVEDVEVLKAKIRNQTELMRWAPEPAKTLYRNNIAVLQAKLRAAVHAKRVQLEGEQAQRTWRIFGWTFTGTGVLVGGAAALALLSLAGKHNRSKRGGAA